MKRILLLLIASSLAWAQVPQTKPIVDPRLPALIERRVVVDDLWRRADQYMLLSYISDGEFSKHMALIANALYQAALNYAVFIEVTDDFESDLDVGVVTRQP